MSIRAGNLYVDGNIVENTGSMGICYYCKKDSTKCGAFDDDSTTTVSYYGAPAIVKWKDLMRISQICSCPIDVFEYKNSGFMKKCENHE